MAGEEYGISQDEMFRVIISISSNPVGAHIAWNFFKANWHVFFER